MTKNALASLPNDWQDWITGNLARACNPSEMAEIMMRDGHLDLASALAAIEEASDGKTQLRAAMDMPEIDTSSNSIHTSDRVVDVLLTLAAPRIVLLGNVLSEDECDALTGLLRAGPDALTRGRRCRRLNANAPASYQPRNNAPKGRNQLVERIEARLSQIARWPIERGEGLQVQQYEATNEYQPHFDWFDPELPGPRKHMEHGGQRLATFVLYLSHVEAGGGTAFPRLGLEVVPKKGSAIFFQNTNTRHVPDRRTLHAGNPVVRGVKTIANKWLRERDY